MHRYEPGRGGNGGGGRYVDRDSDDSNVDAEVLERARKAARAKIGFYKHAVAWAVVSAFLFMIDIFTGNGWWFFWPVLGWGIAIAFHAGSVYLGDGFQQRLEDREVERMTRRRGD